MIYNYMDELSPIFVSAPILRVSLLLYEDMYALLSEYRHVQEANKTQVGLLSKDKKQGVTVVHSQPQSIDVMAKYLVG